MYRVYDKHLFKLVTFKSMQSGYHRRLYQIKGIDETEHIPQYHQNNGVQMVFA